MVSAFEERRNVLLEALDEMGLTVPTPRGAFYVMPEVPDGWVDDVIEEGVIVVPGDAFGDRGEGYARMSYAIGMEDLKDAIRIMQRVTKQYN
jgi:aspartate aminotransferase